MSYIIPRRQAHDAARDAHGSRQFIGRRFWDALDIARRADARGDLADELLALGAALVSWQIYAFSNATPIG